MQSPKIRIRLRAFDSRAIDRSSQAVSYTHLTLPTTLRV